MVPLKEKVLSCTPHLRENRSQKEDATYYIIFMGLSLDGKHIEFSLGQRIQLRDWDRRNKRPLNRPCRPDLVKIKSLISTTITKLHETYDYLQTCKETITVNDILDCYRGDDIKKKNDNHGLVAIFDSETERVKKCNLIADTTLERRACNRRTFVDFLKKYYKREDYPVEKIDTAFIRKYETYLMSDRKQSQNTMARTIKFLKTIIFYSIANGYILKDPFYGIKYHTVPIDHPFLTMEEVQSLLSKDLEIERLEKVRDVFCFCCFTGLSYIDVFNLKKSDIIKNMGDYWIHKTRQKSNQVYEVPLCDVAYKIVMKYSNSNPDSDKLFPVNSNTKMNAYLKELAAICNINKNLTTHCARRTFATLCQMFGTSLQNIAKMMGHSNVTMTQKYAHILNSNVLQDSRRLNGQFTYE